MRYTQILAGFYVMNEYDGLMSMILKMLKMLFRLAEIFVYGANKYTVCVLCIIYMP